MIPEAQAATATPPPAPSREPMIEVDHLTKVYGSHEAVRDVSFSVARGEVLGFLGPNGAGKSTTMRILACYTPATSGRAAIAGFDVATQSFEARSRLGYLPESAPAYASMRVRSFLAFMAGIKGIARSGRRAAIDRALEECGLTDVADRPIGNLSKGFRQRVGLAQAVLGDPAVLILDEPTVGLDPRQIAGIRNLIRGMAGRRTVLLSTHILPEVSMICQRVVVIDRGRVVATGTPERLETRSATEEPPIHVTVRGEGGGAGECLEKVAGVAAVRRLDSAAGRTTFRVEVRAGAEPRPEMARALTGAGHDLLELGTPGMSLEDVFLRVISRSHEPEAGA
jgi:ABC-2 type transport system ATP-binding protein